MKKQLIIIMILILGVVIDVSSQPLDFGKSKEYTLVGLYRTKKEGEIDNIKIYDTYIRYDLVYKRKVYGYDIISFKDNYYFGLKTHTLPRFYQEFVDTFNKLWGIPIGNNVWITKTKVDSITYKCVHLVSLTNTYTVVEAYYFKEKDEGDYLKFIESKIKK